MNLPAVVAINHDSALEQGPRANYALASWIVLLNNFAGI